MTTFSTGARTFDLFADDVHGYAVREVDTSITDRVAYRSCAHPLTRTASGLVQIGAPMPGVSGAEFGPPIENMSAFILGEFRREIVSRSHLEWLSLSDAWTRIDTFAVRRAMAHLDAWLDEPGYAAIGAWQHSDGRIAVVYTDPACHGAFAVTLDDAARAAGDYSEWCNSTTDLADAELAALVRDEPTIGRGHRLRYSGACTLVLPDDE